MSLAIAVFVAGAIEYVLAAYWTQVVVSNHASKAAMVTFVNVLLWGFVVMNLSLGNPWILAAHALGCSLGVAIACLWAQRFPVDPGGSTPPST